MRRSLAMQVQYYLTSRQQNKRRALVLRCLAVVVAFVTAYALIIPAVTQSNELLCGMEAHTHTEDCWTVEMVAPQPELICMAGEGGEIVIHTHDSDCCNSAGELICTLPERELHVHSSDCYREHRDLICEESQSLGHTHGPSCYTYERGELTCGMEVGSGHIHTDACYSVQRGGTPDCGQAEGGGHTHTSACYAEERSGTPDCGQAETEGHAHTDACYTTEQSLTCGQAEGEDVLDEEGNVVQAGHSHSDSCYSEKTVLACGQKETEGHTHTDACYPSEQVLTCTQEEDQGHTHTDACYPEERVLACQEEEQGHVHTDSCYEWTQSLTCQEEERESGHIHTDACYEITELLACQQPELILHVHTESCYLYDEENEENEEPELICEEPEIVLHQHTSECFHTPEGEPVETRLLVCGEEEHVHTEGCYVEIIPKEEDIYFCGEVEHIHAEDCYFESGALCCTLEEHVHSLDCLEEPPEEIEIPGELTSQGPTHIELDDYFDYETDAFHATFHVMGIAALNDGEDDAPLSVDSGNGYQPEGPVDDADLGTAVAGDISTPQQPDDTAAAETPEDASHTEDADNTDTGNDTVISDDARVPLADVPDRTEAYSPSEDGTEPDSTSESSPYLDASNVEFTVELLNEDSQEYRQMASQVEEEYNDDMELPMLQVMTFSARYEGRELDLSGCVVEMELTLSEPLVEYLNSYQESQPMAVDSEDGGEGTEGSGFTVMALTGDEELGGISELASMNAISRTTSMIATLSNEGDSNNTVAIALLPKTFPNYTVEFYANINRPAIGDDQEGGAVKLPFIDTSAAGNETDKAVLPQNGNTKAKETGMWINADGTVIFNKNLEEVYKAKEKLVFNPQVEGTDDRLTVDRLNALKDNPHYALKGMWVLQPGGDPENEEDWTVYDSEQLERIRFTNNPKSTGDNVVLIQQNDEGNTVLRLIYDPTNGTEVNEKTVFYDYDVTDGKVTDGNKVNVWEQGINSGDNFTGNGTKLTFGNGKGTLNIGWNNEDKDTKWENNGTNTPNQANNGNGFNGCTFGLVKGLTSSGALIFADKIDAPALFGAEQAVGKSDAIRGYNLNFDRQGDTYTLTSVTGTNVQNLNQFKNMWNWNNTKKIYYNSFYPVDGVQKEKQDPLFGVGSNENPDYKTNPPSGVGAQRLPASDDGQKHNHYFGMNFSVGFTLEAEYVGPLEYYFYGDDDMWVFLDGELVCDIGGVHSAVGEYVDLWDYIEGGKEGHEKKTHTLQIFYTERGASGSTCWMQYTLPNMMAIPVQTPPNMEARPLRVEKHVESEDEAALEYGYEFTIQLTNVTETFAAEVYSAEGEVLYTIEGINSETPTEFTLHDGEYLEILGSLPTYAGYKITEKRPGLPDIVVANWKPTIETIHNGNYDKPFKNESGTDTSGNVGGDVVVVKYTNSFNYQLPETGGPGNNLYIWAGALLFAAAGCLWYKKQTYRGGARDET